MNRLITASIVITVLLIICTFDDFLSLHDIKNDYVSKPVLEYLSIETSNALPTWTNTTLEWTSIKISYLLRTVLIISNLCLLILLKKRNFVLKAEQQQGKTP